MAEAVTADEARPLTDAEKAVLRDLMAREAAFASPATRTGEPYEALVNLSVPRRGGDKDRNTDLVMAGETIYLTEEEARNFNRHGNRDGRQVPVLRKLTGPDSTSEAPRLLPRHMSGRLFRPAVPPPGSEMARPDPEGSSRIQVLDDGRAPEAAGSVPAEAQEMADLLRSAPPQDAVDLPPRHRQRTRGGQ